MPEPIPPADPTTGTWRLKQIGLAKLLHNLSISERTGTLVLKRGEVSKSIFFKNGYVMFAESNLATDRLGEVLCRRGEITRAQLSECLAESKRTGKMLGAVLVEKNVLRAERLLPAIEVQVREIVLGAFSWDDGEYLFSKEFFGNTEDLLDLKIRTADLILEGVRRTYTATQASKVLGDTSRPPKLSAESGYLSQELTVNFESSKVLAKIDGQRSIAQIVAETGLTELTVLQILAALAHLKIVEADPTGNTGKINMNQPGVASPPAPTPAPGATDVRVRAARVEEMRAHDEVTQLLDRLPPLVSQLLFDPAAGTAQVLAAAGPDAEAIGRSFGGGRRILDVLQERNYTLELVRAVAYLYSAGALKPATGAPATGNGWQPAATPGGGGGWQAAPGGGAPAPAPSSSWQVPGAGAGAPAPANNANAGFPATKAAPPAPPPAAKPPEAAGFPATKAPSSPAAPANGAGGFGAPAPAPGAWGAPVAAPPAPAPAAQPWQKSAAIPLGGGAPVPAPPATPPPAAAAPWAQPPVAPPKPPAPPPRADANPNAPIAMPPGPGPVAAPPPAAPPAAPAWSSPPPPPAAGWGAPVAAPVAAPPAVPPPPVAPSMPWAQPAPAPVAAAPVAAPPSPAPPTGPNAARPTGPAVWNVPSAPTPNAPPPTPTVATPPPPPGPGPSVFGNGAAQPPLAPTPAPAPVPMPPPNEFLDLAPDAINSLDTKTADKGKDKKPSPPPKTTGDGKSRRPLMIGGGLVAVVGAVAGLLFAGIIPGLGGPTPIAAITPTPQPTATTEATVAPTDTAVVVASATPEATATVAATSTPAVTAVVVATPAPTATPTAVAIATNAATPAPTKAPEDPEAKKKKAATAVKVGNDALNAGDATKAIRNFGVAIANDPTNAEAHLGLGTAYMIGGDNAKAKKSLQKFLQLAPDHQYASQTRQILGTL